MGDNPYNYNDFTINCVGVTIGAGASRNTIGGTTAAAADLISGNGGGGVAISGGGTDANVVEGDLIGTTVTGHSELPNGPEYQYGFQHATDKPAWGVLIQGGATNNTVGGTVAAAADVISGNDGDGVIISGAGTHGNVVEGNLIGTSVTGDTDLPNHSDGYQPDFTASYEYVSGSGVVIRDGAAANTVGGSAAGARNVISDDEAYGIRITLGRWPTMSRGMTSAPTRADACAWRMGRVASRSTSGPPTTRSEGRWGSLVT